MERITEIPRLKPRQADSHKGTFGKICIAAGSFGFTGAAVLCGKSALRCGAGLVRLAVPKTSLPIVASAGICYTAIPLPEDRAGQMSPAALNTLLAYIEDNDVFGFGPGCGTNSGVRGTISGLIEAEGLRLVIDADGLNCLCKIKDWPERKKADIILTPHPGEFARLWKALFREEMPDSRDESAVKLAERTGSAVVLKGAGTVVTDADRIYVNDTGNPGMATAGVGDVLTGMITALAGQGMGNFDAAAAGVYIHGIAGDIAAERFGQISMTAEDIIESLPEAFGNC